MNYGWPGNVRELQNLMERSVLLSGGAPITSAHFLLDPDTWPLFEEEKTAPSLLGEPGNHPAGNRPDSPDETAVQLGAPAGAVPSPSFDGAVIPLHEMERIMIAKGLEQTAGNRTQAAELLGISVRTLRNKLNEYRAQGLEID